MYPKSEQISRDISSGMDCINDWPDIRPRCFVGNPAKTTRYPAGKRISGNITEI